MPNQNEYLAKKSLLDTKQDTLTAGDNININNNNVISVQGLPKDVKVDGSSVVDINGNANIDLTGKQDVLTAGNNITIQNNEISANIEANPQDTPTEDLNSIEIDGTVYNIAGSGGSNVIPNPVGTPTDTLNTVEINGTIFDIEGSGSGSGLIDDIIYSSSVDNSVIPLSNSIANYDYIWVMAGYSQDGQDIKLGSIFNASDLENAIGTTERFGISNDAYYIYFSVDSLTQFSKYTWQDRVFIQEVHGLKFGGGGSAITPNPQGEPTDTLETIEIDGTVFNIAGSGGGSAYSETTLWSGSDSASMTLSESFENYDAVMLVGKNTYNNTDYSISGIWLTSYLKTHINDGMRFGLANDSWYVYFSITNDTTFIRQDQYSIYISEIKGVKFGGGGSSGKAITETTLWTGSVPSPDTSGVLSEPLSNYDYLLTYINIPTKDGEYHIDCLNARMLKESLDNGVQPFFSYEYYDTMYRRCKFTDETHFTYVEGDGNDCFYSKITGIKIGTGGSGGTSVEANPQEQPTDILTKIKIEDTVYEIQGGGSSEGSGLQRTVLWDYAQDNAGTIPYDIFSVTLRDDINNYDAITLELVSWANDLNGAWRGTNISNTFFVDVLNNQLEPGNIVVCTFAQRSVKFYIHDNIVSTTVRNESSTNGLVRVYGLTFGGGKAASEIIPITAGDGTASRTFTFNKTPKFIAYYWNDPILDNGWNTTAHFVWGQEFIAYGSATNVVSINNNYQGCIRATYNGNSVTFTGGNAFAACNTVNGSGYMYVDYGGGSGGSSEPDISDMTWTAITSTSYGQSTAVAIPQGTKRLVLTAEYEGIVTKVAEEKIENIQKLLDTSLQNTWNMGAEYADTSGNYTFVAMSVNNNLATAYSGYSGVVVKIYALS